MAILDDARTAVRITHTSLDDELNGYISACKADLARAGISSEITESDPLVHQAIILYVRWQCDYCGNGDKYERAYKYLADSMALCGDYGAVAVTADDE